MGAWDVIDREDDMNVIRLTWAFKVNQYPDGLIKMFKAILCARGYLQLGGIYIFETYMPVVQLTTISVMIILEILLQLKSKQGDITAAFLNAKLEENGKSIYRYAKRI